MPDPSETLNRIKASVEQLVYRAARGPELEAAGEIGRRIQEAGERGVKTVKDWWRGTGKQKTASRGPRHGRASSRR